MEKNNERETEFSLQEFYVLAGKVERYYAEYQNEKKDRGQTFGQHLDSFYESYKAALTAKTDKEYKTAWKLYKQVEGEWQWLQNNLPWREKVATQKRSLAVLHQEMNNELTKHYAQDIFQTAVLLEEKANNYFESGRFEEAGKIFKEAEKAFEETKQATENASREMSNIVFGSKAPKNRKESIRRYLFFVCVLCVVCCIIWGVKNLTSSSIRTNDSVNGVEENKVSYNEDSNGEITITLKRGITIILKPVEAGTFIMGSSDNGDDEKPPHKVTLSKNYWMAEKEVTQMQYEILMGTNPSCFKNDALCPVESVSFDEAEDFCKRLNNLFEDQLPDGYELRLPTEAEWDFAARGGNKNYGYKYSGSGSMDEVGWYDEKWGEGSTHPVGLKKANELGLYDMSGNVWEWCRDWYGAYTKATVTNPVGPTTGSHRVIRGGSWSNAAERCRSGNRLHSDPSKRISNLGFRFVLAPIQ